MRPRRAWGALVLSIAVIGLGPIAVAAAKRAATPAETQAMLTAVDFQIDPLCAAAFVSTRDPRWATLDDDCASAGALAAVLRRAGDDWRWELDVDRRYGRLCSLLAPMPPTVGAELGLCDGSGLVVAARPSGAITQLGPLRPHRVHDLESHERETSYAAAVEAFGPPPRLRRLARWRCIARWPGIGLEIDFADYGGGVACRDGGFVQFALVYGDGWHTPAGLRIGDRVRRLRRLYPSAERHGHAWWLVRRYSRIGEGGWFGPLTAIVRDGRVRSLRAAVGAAGE
jgi:hypothetical protein